MTIQPPRRSQYGFSLVELMVAMVVGLILLAGVLQILLSNRESFDVQKAMAALQQDARLASFFIENAISHAGYHVELEPDLEFIFRDGIITATEGPGAEPDSLQVFVQAGGGVTDCGGTRIGGASPEVATFGFAVDDDSNLECIGTALGADGALVNNVEALEIRYGLDTDGDNSVDTYQASLTPEESFEVRSVRVQLLLASPQNVLPSPVDQEFVFASGLELPFEADRRAWQMVDLHVALRNLLP